MMRRPKLTYKMVDEACELKGRGLTNADICRALGISETAWYNWLREPDSKVKLALVQGLKKSESAYKGALLDRIRTASEKPQHWTAAAWLLERKYPEEYGRPETRKAEAEADDRPQITLGVEVRVAKGDGVADAGDVASDDLDGDDVEGGAR